MDKAKTAKISNFWTFWSVMQLIYHRLRYHIIDVPGVLKNSVLGAYNCLSTLIT